MLKHIWLTFFLCKTLLLSGQSQYKPNSNEIYRDIKALNFLGTAMYIAAHPDDENTRLISYLSNFYHAKTYYLSLTRGDGGQNLLGTDLREALGIIRTQELLKARKIDGGEQRFTRAVDFGYSKSPDETLNIWNRDSVLHDLVWQIRQLKPDIIINRFDHRTSGTTHGHHTTSALLSIDAFDLAVNKNAFPEDLSQVDTWQPKRLFFNTSWWFYGSRDNFEKANKSNLISLDIGTYYPDLGLSNTEIASLSRSQHKSQAFGNTPNRGEQLEYLEIIKGDKPGNENIFDGIDTSWKRVKGGEKIDKLIKNILNNYNHTKPYESVPELVKVYNEIQKIDDVFWKKMKSNEVTGIIKSCLGLYIESIADESFKNPKDSVNLDIEIVNRSPEKVILKRIILPDGNDILYQSKILQNNKTEHLESVIKTGEAYTNPYWLNRKPKEGLYNVSDKKLIGLPETPTALKLKFILEIENTPIEFESEVVYKYNDRIDGEVYQNFEILPEVSLIIEDVFIFKNSKPKEIEVKVKSYTDEFNGKLSLNLSENWKFSPQSYEVELKNKGAEKSFLFMVTPPNTTETIKVEPFITAKNKIFNKDIKELDYDHINLQTYLKPASSNLVNINVVSKAGNIGYIKGAGDKIPEALESLGLDVTQINIDKVLNTAELKAYDAIILGIRAFNTEKALTTKNELLFEYVKHGGTLIVQYNTTYSLLTEKVSPLRLDISRDRVTDENAKVDYINPSHKILNYPNKITSDDFNGWTQERGLYFPSDWGTEFEPVFSIKDYDEGPYQGSLLVAPYGEGYYIYTGLSFFRQLPAGVPGAFRLLANMISINSNE